MGLESWRQVWRDGFLPSIRNEELIALRDLLEADDPRMTQGSTTTPPPLMCVQDWPAEAACFVGLIGVFRNGGFGQAKVGEVEECFARLCFECGQAMSDSAACRYLLNWADDTPRPTVIRELLAEIELAIGGRQSPITVD